ncbi:TfoX/Sxy family protein [Nocardioides sp. JQ2195]|uniref:TfoX/Sxy family protein n=1 Tax=Nocardioides sp. JQ2195 TaxID=2592334 RepID=UPI00143ED3EC|nr:TfoX/Sxy family protein [Nocardioides sp. JQ2195]QIX27500.1 TfoX/Sxy family protein [Nocardioides sp. JQ2195]
MAYDEELAERIRHALAGAQGCSEKRMFGGLAFLRNGNMAVAATNHGQMMVRVDPDRAEELITAPGVRRMVMKARELNGWVEADAVALERAEDLARWVDEGWAFAGTLPAK